MLTEKERELHVELAKLCQQSREKRISDEWRVAFGLWAGIALFTWFATTREIHLSGGELTLLGLAYLSVLLIWVFAWQLPVHRGDKEDANWKHWFMDHAEGRPSRPAQDPRGHPTSYWYPGRKPWFWGFVLMTAVFLALSFLIIRSASRLPAPDHGAADRLSGDNLRILLEKLPTTNPATRP